MNHYSRTARRILRRPHLPRRQRPLDRRTARQPGRQSRPARLLHHRRRGDRLPVAIQRQQHHGATTSAYSIASVAATNFGSYACADHRHQRHPHHQPRRLDRDRAAGHVAPTGSLTVTPGPGAAFSVTAAGTTPLSCQWQFNSTPISGATGTSYTLTGAQSTNAGSYTVVVTNLRRHHQQRGDAHCPRATVHRDAACQSDCHPRPKRRLQRHPGWQQSLGLPVAV